MRITGQAIKASIMAEKHAYCAQNGREPQRIFLSMDLYDVLTKDLPWEFVCRNNKRDAFIGIPITLIAEKGVFYFGEGAKQVRLSDGNIRAVCRCPKCGRVVYFGGTGEEKLKLICFCGYKLEDE